MLIVERYEGQSILIDGKKIEIKFLGMHGIRARLGITAPPEVKVNRKEIYEALKEDRENAESKS